MQLSLLTKSRRRRKIRAKLEEVSRIVSSPHIAYDNGLALFSAASCALITSAGDIIVTPQTSTRPFESASPQIRALRATAANLRTSLGATLDVVHVRGDSTMLHCYGLGPHTLVTLTQVSPGARHLDAVLARIDQCLGVGGEGHTLIEQLEHMLEEL